MKHLLAQLNAQVPNSDPLASERVARTMGLSHIAGATAQGQQLHIYKTASGAMVTLQNGRFHDNNTWWLGEVVTQTEAAKIAGISRQGINIAISRSAIPRYWTNGGWVLKTKDVIEKWKK